jgi:hypothetical protein
LPNSNSSQFLHLRPILSNLPPTSKEFRKMSSSIARFKQFTVPSIKANSFCFAPDQQGEEKGVPILPDSNSSQFLQLRPILSALPPTSRE